MLLHFVFLLERRVRELVFLTSMDDITLMVVDLRQSLEVPVVPTVKQRVAFSESDEVCYTASPCAQQSESAVFRVM